MYFIYHSDVKSFLGISAHPIPIYMSPADAPQRASVTHMLHVHAPWPTCTQIHAWALIHHAYKPLLGSRLMA